jgi:HEAT repeats
MSQASKFAPLLLLIATPVAFGQDITARFYPEKQQYVVGEPIVIVLEVTNRTSHAVEVDDENCRWMHASQFQVTNATVKAEVGLLGCASWGGIAGDCLSGARRTPPGGTFEQRFLLDDPSLPQFDLSEPGTYHVKATRQVTIYRKNGLGDIREIIDAENEFDIMLRNPDEGELEARYERFVKDLGSTDYKVSSLAGAALTQDPPEFLESVILSLADSRDMGLRYQSIQGLKRLATPAARTKLIDMASDSDESLAQQAIPALGEIANPKDCAAILKIAVHWRQYTQSQAYMAAGRICREKAVLPLTSLLSSADEELAMAIATGLGNTASRDAIPPLIGLLASPDRFVRRQAEGALFTLTHRSMQDVSTAEAAAQVSSGWRSWRLMNSESAQVYGPDQCPAASSQ